MGYPAGPFRRTALAWMALAGMLVMSAGPVAIGHPSADTDCVPAVAVEHDHAAHRVGQAPEPDAGHCVACHLTRSARGMARPGELPPIATAESDVVIDLHAPARPTVSRARFTRGPPSLG